MRSNSETSAAKVRVEYSVLTRNSPCGLLKAGVDVKTTYDTRGQHYTGGLQPTWIVDCNRPGATHICSSPTYCHPPFPRPGSGQGRIGKYRDCDNPLSLYDNPLSLYGNPKLWLRGQDTCRISLVTWLLNQTRRVAKPPITIDNSYIIYKKPPHIGTGGIQWLLIYYVTVMLWN